ncbi:MAG: hypothetical protein AB1589_12900 [Cyanobacteriota bacterium]
MVSNQRLKNQDEIIAKIQGKILDTLSKEMTEPVDFQKLQSLSVSLKALSEATALLNNLP